MLGFNYDSDKKVIDSDADAFLVVDESRAVAVGDQCVHLDGWWLFVWL